jgi:murein DD-endopeptidase MepM/ murein hydrolase activator NlpD
MALKKYLPALLLWPTLIFSHPLISVDILNKTPKQGDAVWIKIKSSKKIESGTIMLNKKKFKLFQKSNGSMNYLSCIGISRFATPSKATLGFRFIFSDGSQYTTQLPITIAAANFKQEHITLKPKKYKISQDKTSRKNENRLIEQKFSTVTPAKKFHNEFLWPLAGRISSKFGTQRVYNNTPGWSHSGTDISAKEGTPIQASQSGTIVLSKSLNVHGNTVMINHGWGIVSIYNHLHQLNVKLNDKVTKGDIIGTVGSTGIATGPHLHFGISIQSIRVDPEEWVHKTSKTAI